MERLIREKNNSLSTVMYPGEVRTGWVLMFLALISGLGAGTLMIGNPEGSPIIFFLPALFLFIGLLSFRRMKKTIIHLTENGAYIESDGEKKKIKAIYVWPHTRRTRGYSTYSTAYYNVLYFGIAAVLENDKADWQKVLEKYRTISGTLHDRETAVTAVLEGLVKDAKTLTLYSRIFPVYRAVKELGRKLDVPVIIALSGTAEVWYPSEIGQTIRERVEEYSAGNPAKPELGSIEATEQNGVLSFTWTQKKLIGLIIPAVAGVILFVVAVGSAAEGAVWLSIVLIFAGLGFSGFGLYFFRGHGKNILEVDTFETRHKWFRPWKRTRLITHDELETILANHTTERALYFLGRKEKMKVIMEGKNACGVKTEMYRFLCK
jgi:hypothetical protein